MSVATAEPVLSRPIPVGPPRPTTVPRPTTAPGRTRPARTGPGTGPAAAPRRLRFTAPSTHGTRAACRPAPPTVRQSLLPRASRRSSWRLTERGLAVVLVLAAALVAASVTVVALTAVRVTGDSYAPARATSAPVALAQD